jgi:hypothetical protein
MQSSHDIDCQRGGHETNTCSSENRNGVKAMRCAQLLSTSWFHKRKIIAIRHYCSVVPTTILFQGARERLDGKLCFVWGTKSRGELGTHTIAFFASTVIEPNQISIATLVQVVSIGLGLTMDRPQKVGWTLGGKRLNHINIIKSQLEMNLKCSMI